jgi:hypothetical protein
MTLLALEQRVKSLETQVARIEDELRSAAGSGKTKDWRRTIGAFTDDEGLKEILQDAMRLREADRTKVRAKRAPKRRAKR